MSETAPGRTFFRFFAAAELSAEEDFADAAAAGAAAGAAAEAPPDSSIFSRGASLAAVRKRGARGASRKHVRCLLHGGVGHGARWRGRAELWL